MTHLETFAMVIVTAIVLGLVKEGLDRIFRKPIQRDANGKPLVFVTQDELIKFCTSRQESCAAKQILQHVEKTVSDMNLQHQSTVESMKTELKSEIKEVRELVIRALSKDNSKGG